MYNQSHTGSREDGNPTISRTISQHYLKHITYDAHIHICTYRYTCTCICYAMISKPRAYPTHFSMYNGITSLYRLFTDGIFNQCSWKWLLPHMHYAYMIQKRLSIGKTKWENPYLNSNQFSLLYKMKCSYKIPKKKKIM